MNKKYKEQINYLMGKCELLEKQEADLRNNQHKLNRKNEELQNQIDILKFTGTFDLNKVQVNIVTNPVVSVLADSVAGLLRGECKVIPAIECKYVKDDKLESVHYILDDEKYENVDSNTEVKIKDNYTSYATIKIEDRWFILDKLQNVIVEIPAPEKKTQGNKEKKCTKK